MIFVPNPVKTLLYMDVSEYIPLLVVFAVIFYFSLKGKSSKHYEETAKTTLPGRKSGKIISLPKMLAEPLKLKAEIPKKKIDSPVQKVMIPLEGEEALDGFSFGEEIEEIRKGILYAEILNWKKGDGFI